MYVSWIDQQEKMLGLVIPYQLLREILRMLLLTLSPGS